MKRIDKLTSKQISLFPQFVDKWVKNGLSCEPANFDLAEKGVRAGYESSGLKQPIVVLRMVSPRMALRGMCIAHEILKKMKLDVDQNQVIDQVRAQVDAQVYSQVSAQVYSQVIDQVRAQVIDQVRAQVYSQVSDQVRDQVSAQVIDQVRAQVDAQVDAQVYSQVSAQVYSQVIDQVSAQVYSQVIDQVRDQVSDQVRAQVYSQVSDQVRDQVSAQVRAQVDAQEKKFRYEYRGGNLWSAWYSYADFFTSLGLEYKNKDIFVSDKMVAENSGWVFYSSGVASISDRPCELHRNDAGQLHNESGAAILWRDGYSLYSIGGVRLDEQVVMSPETQTIDQIKNENNEEIKRIRINRYAGMNSSSTDGWRKYLKEIGAKCVDESSNEIENTKERLLVSGDGQKILVCACPSTARVYALEVPPETKKCLDAQNWLGEGSALSRRFSKISIIGRS